MRLISLNTWGGQIYEPFVSFIKKHAQTTDVFCFQEVNDNPPVRLGDDSASNQNLFEELKQLLPNHIGHFAPQIQGIGIAIFIRGNISVAQIDSTTILETQEMTEKFISRVLQHVEIENPNISIYNFHGVPKSNKLDTPERLLQTKRLLKIIEEDVNPKILVGDFNLRPETLSLQAFEKTLRNLVIENNIKTTRSNLYPFKAVQPFADYVFTSADITVKDFKVLPDEVSDHLALFLDFGVR